MVKVPISLKVTNKFVKAFLQNQFRRAVCFDLTANGLPYLIRMLLSRSQGSTEMSIYFSFSRYLFFIILPRPCPPQRLLFPPFHYLYASSLFRLLYPMRIRLNFVIAVRIFAIWRGRAVLFFNVFRAENRVVMSATVLELNSKFWTALSPGACFNSELFIVTIRAPFGIALGRPFHLYS